MPGEREVRFHKGGDPGINLDILGEVAITDQSGILRKCKLGSKRGAVVKAADWEEVDIRKEDKFTSWAYLNEYRHQH